MRFLIILGCFLLPNAQLLAAREDVLLNADREFGRVTAQKGAAGFVSFFDEAGTILPKAGDPVVGKDKLGPVFENVWSTPGYSLTWTPLKAVLAKSGELGYTYGTYVRKFQRNGETVTETGKYVTVWKKQRGGGWKVLLDMGN